MRLISLGVLFSDRFVVENVVNVVEQNFPNYLPNYRIHNPDDSNHIFFFEKKLL